MTIRRVLVANRGEITRRVFRTCRELGIETVAVHSDADAAMAFVQEADVAVRLPGDVPGDTYLRGDLVVEAALRTGADAVHPGYGFLSENAGFARQVVEAGLTWIGPSPESIDVMGSKVAAKKLVARAGVPVLEEVDPADVAEADLPLLVKASAGGGGRGMRVLRALDEVGASVELAAAEAASAFGDPTVFCEPFVEQGRHVEVQVVGDSSGDVLVLGDRDCSIQRRHQKIVEEAPAPGLSDTLRAAMHDAARATAESVGYVGAGTVEFLLDPGAERFWFLEMNTRLQVEHPVTEAVTGVDLVELQLTVAEGRRLDPPAPGRHVAEGGGEATGGRGCAVEARLYAEDPAADWQPQSGRLTRFEIPDVAAWFGPLAAYGVRVDSGFRSGDEVSTHYDAMLAKVVAWAPTREQALRRLAGTLSRARIHGVRTNRDLLVNVLRHGTVVAGEVSTDFFDRHPVEVLARPRADDDAVRVSAFAAAVALAELDAAGRTVQRDVPVGWRNVVSAPHTTRFEPDLEIRWHGGRTGYSSPDLDVAVVSAELSGTCVAVALQRPDNSARRFDVHVGEDGAVDVESSLGHVALRPVPRFVDPADQVATGSLLAPMPGSVVSVAVAAGDPVTAGQPVLVLEAMKMQHSVTAPNDGVVTELPVSAGDQIAAGAVLAVVSTSPTAEDAGPTAGEEGDTA